jgi:phosphatidylglycerol:prolipoprotein diacylglycerol transferase
LVPVLLSFRIAGGVVSIASYGVLIAVGLAAAIALAHRRAGTVGLDPGRVLDLAFWMTLSGFVGARVLYAIVNAGDYARACVSAGGEPRTLGEVIWDCTRVLRVWEGGLVFYGGVAAAALVGFRFARAEGWSFASVGDLFAPPLALGHAFGRLGCFLAGCCFGKPSAAGWAAHFPRGSVAFDELAVSGAVALGADVTPGLHPTQLYEALGDFTIFAALMVLGPRLLRRRGATLLVYLGLYAALRFTVEMFRGDAGRRFVAALETPRLAALLHLPPGDPILLSVGQATSLAALAIVIAVLVRRSVKSRDSAA